MTPKPGNVFPGKEFDDASVQDFLQSAAAVAPVIAQVSPATVGLTILNSIRATRRIVDHNTNLGIVLLITPLAAVPPSSNLKEGISLVLNQLSVADSVFVYEAIRLAAPGGLGEATEQDVQSVPNLDLRQCMQLAAEYDLIARQYSGGFQEVLGTGLDWLSEARLLSDSQPIWIQTVALRLLATFGDSLIARKCGADVSRTVRDMAGSVLNQGWPTSPQARSAWQMLDEFLRADGHRRNPGTTADMIAAILFAGLREGQLTHEGHWWKTENEP